MNHVFGSSRGGKKKKKETLLVFFFTKLQLGRLLPASGSLPRDGRTVEALRDAVMMSGCPRHHMGLIRGVRVERRGGRNRTELCVCVSDRLGLVNVCVFLWKSLPGSTNTADGSTPAGKQRLL